MTTAAVRRSDARVLADTEVTAMIRAELKAAFPAVKFSVRKTHAGAVAVNYTDGPTVARVKAIAGRYEGKGFDGMTDSTTYADAFQLATGEWVRTYCYVFVNRSMSAAFTARVVAAVSKRYGLTAPAIDARGNLAPTVEQDQAARGVAGCWWSELVYRAAGDRSSVAG